MPRLTSLCRVSRRDQESTFGRFWRYTDTRINLQPVDEENPRLGGRVQATETVFDVTTLTFASRKLHGVYGEDFLTYGEFVGDADVANEEVLLKIFEEDGDGSVVDRHWFKFEDQKVSYQRDVDYSAKDEELEHHIAPTVLDETVEDSWSETLFYGVGNKSM